ncbi:thermonuclease family protein [Mycoplasmopsis canis]|uniref:thermonuclease family protein n=1 Tax=Mycoplasmopsis canis TaxID=29555 RepID=UPI00025AECBB|nr:thermonuclease family protein [Mycoplasmopsis canis]EIE40766.1 hypothetical protein MCANUF33_01408 [Mycoplasmopsis canis UF33]
MPKEIYVKINNKKIKLLLSNITKDIEYGKLGEKNQNKEMQNLAQSIENIPVKYTFSYMPSYNSYNVSGLDNINIIKVENVNINPTLKNLTINSNSDNFKPTGISFEDSSISGSAFKAKIQSVSDGDTFSVVSLENKTLKGGIQIIKDEVYKSRLSGIDTPEKGIADANKYISASPFEYSFALHATNFANQVINNDKYKNNVMVGFVPGKDTFNRVTADIFFGENYQFSYNAEIVRSGHTLPYSNDIWKLKFTEKDKNSYEYNLYPFISEAFEEAIKNKKGMFNYFSHPEDASLFVYKIKNNNKWHPFYWEKTNKDDIVKDYIKN